jgi:hypothetical protein
MRGTQTTNTKRPPNTMIEAPTASKTSAAAEMVSSYHTDTLCDRIAP